MMISHLSYYITYKTHFFIFQNDSKYLGDAFYLIWVACVSQCRSADFQRLWVVLACTDFCLKVNATLMDIELNVVTTFISKYPIDKDNFWTEYNVSPIYYDLYASRYLELSGYGSSLYS